MSKIIKSIETNFISFLNDYSKILIEKFNLNEVEVQKVTDTYVFNNMNIILNDTTTSSLIGNSKKATKPKNENVIKCSHVFTKGNKIGEICSLNAKDGSSLCSRHSKTMNKEEQKEEVKSVIDSAKKNNLQKVVLGLNKEINRYWHKETKLVFHSKEKLVVIGRIRDDNKFYEELRDEDIDLCKKYHFKFERINSKPKVNLDELKKKNIEDAIDDLLLKHGITSSASSSDNETDDDDNDDEMLNEDD